MERSTADSRLNPVDLVFSVALARELPVAWLREHGVPVHRAQALAAGALKHPAGAKSGVLVVITGVGMAAAREAAGWIRKNIAPRFVVNLGTVGALRADSRIGDWVTPARVENEAGKALDVDVRLPFPWPGAAKRQIGGTLLTVGKARPGCPDPQWLSGNYVDMECYAQALVFANSGIAFHALKWVSDRPGVQAKREFSDALALFHRAVRQVFDFVARPAPPEISVIIPVHNRVGRVAEAIRSVFDQTLPAAEVIVVDDGSDDGTDKLLAGFADTIRVQRLARNSGVSAARNAGVRTANSAWIAFLDSDDRWAADKLAHQWAYREQNPHYQALQCEEIWIRNNVRVNPHKHHAKPGGWIWARSLELCLVSPSALLMGKALFESLGAFDESLPACEDYDLWLRLGRKHVVGLAPGANVIKHGGHDDQLSRRYPAMDRFRVAALTKALHGESDPEYRRQIVTILKKKLEILIQGARKRGLTAQAQGYAHLLSELCGGDMPPAVLREARHLRNEESSE